MSGVKRFGSRLAQLVFVLWAVATILFLIFRLMPGSPLAAYIDPTFTEEQQRILMARFGLDRSLFDQYLIYLWNLLQGDLGESFFYRQPVGERVLMLLPNTLVLSLFSIIIAYMIGVVGGAYLAWKRGSVLEGARQRIREVPDAQHPPIADPVERRDAAVDLGQSVGWGLDELRRDGAIRD